MKAKRKKISLDKKRWAAYAAAGAAATLAGNTADADITLLEPNVTILDSSPSDGFYDVVYTQAFGGASILFQHAQESSFGIGAIIFRRTAATFTMSVAGTLQPGSYNYPSNLPYGQNISTLPNWMAGGPPGTNIYAGRFGQLAWANGQPRDKFVNTGGYLAFRFDVGAGTQYGWAELSLDSGTPNNVFVLERIAWGDAGDSLFVGEFTAIPEPASMGCLALGAVGLLAWRRRRAQSA